MTQLPENDLAIVRQEAAALLSELKGDLDSAIEHRKKEIELTERAQKSVQESVKRGDYDAETAAWALQGRDSKALEKRRACFISQEAMPWPVTKSSLKNWMMLLAAEKTASELLSVKLMTCTPLTYPTTAFVVESRVRSTRASTSDVKEPFGPKEKLK